MKTTKYVFDFWDVLRQKEQNHSVEVTSVAVQNVKMGIQNIYT